ncbi:MAG: hypothetical protein VXW65_06070, partial [Pseudomonadota bacterium]|nr:hypothetical protein [Pseudomonadota bacterium]
MNPASSQHWTLHGELEVNAGALNLVQNAQREVLVWVSNFVQGQFADPDFALALSIFVRSSRYTVAQILVSSEQRILATPHPLLDLQQRLSSLVHLRQV